MLMIILSAVFRKILRIDRPRLWTRKTKWSMAVWAYVLYKGVATGGISVYIPPQISLPYKFLCGCFVHMWDINMF